MSVMVHEAGGGVVCAAPTGDLDLAVAPELDEALSDIAGRGTATMIEVDLGGVTFMDSAGIACLIKGRRMAEEAGCGFRVVHADGLVRRVLEMTGVWGFLGGLAEVSS